MDLDWVFYGFHGSGVDFPWNSWISAGFPWIRTGFSTDFMDLEWIFHGIHGPRLDFHGSGMDFLRISWMSGGFPWIWTGFSTDFMDHVLRISWIWDGFSMEFIALCFLFSYGGLQTSKSGADKSRMEELPISFISDGFSWIWIGFSMEFINLE